MKMAKNILCVLIMIKGLSDIFADEVQVIHEISNAGPNMLKTWQEAKSVCANKGLHMATQRQLKAAWDKGYENCQCGWLADGTARASVQNPRKGCSEGEEPGLVPCSLSLQEGFDVFCSTKKFDITRRFSILGDRKVISWKEAKAVCSPYGEHLATVTELQEALDEGYDNCACGWMADGSIKLPVTYSRTKCGTKGPARLVPCPRDPAEWGASYPGWDVYCSKSPISVKLLFSQDPVNTVAKAEALCLDKGMALATEEDLLEAQRSGYDNCNCGWLADGLLAFPMTYARPECSTEPPGVIHCFHENTTSVKNVYCSESTSTMTNAEGMNPWRLPVYAVAIIAVLAFLLFVAVIVIVFCLISKYRQHNIKSEKNSAKDLKSGGELQQRTVPTPVERADTCRRDSYESLYTYLNPIN